jgi:histidinol dehydrogenase
MEIVINPDRSLWPAITARPETDLSVIFKKVKAVMQEVREDGDAALRKFTQQFDGVALQELRVSEAEISDAASQVSDELKEAIQQAAQNITTFHQRQLQQPEKIETTPGVFCWRKSVGIEKVGLYIPGGSAPLFSTVLMLGIPAKLAGCKEVVLCTPPQKDGSVHPAVLYAASLTGITKMVKVGGSQAIAALACGTETVPQVYKIFGPGNQYVTAAKQLAQNWNVAIDMPAGPSEVCVLADDTCVPTYVAADLLSQAEHGPDSQVLLVTTNEELAKKINIEVSRQLAQLTRRKTAERALKSSNVVVMSNMEDAIDLINEYAPEHLILSCKDDEAIAEKIINAGSIFLGNYSPESVGDYASGTNHTLPTNGFATTYSGVSVDSFVKKITMQKLTKEGLKNLASTVVEMAMAEGLDAHAKAVEVRIDNE